MAARGPLGRYSRESADMRSMHSQNAVKRKSQTTFRPYG
jgi:hypothetical protein